MFGKPHRTYLDYAAAAPVAPGALRVFEKSLPLYGNPGSPHTEGRLAREALEQARTDIARMAEVKTDGVIFTSGATEANALAIKGSVKRLLEEGSRADDVEVLYLATSHASVQGQVGDLKQEGITVKEIPAMDGTIHSDEFQKLLTPSTRLVVMDAVCGETGTRYDTLGVRRMLDVAQKKTGKRILLHVDASQLPFTESFMLARLGADMLTLDAQKVGGVRGIGALLLRHGVELSPIISGGGQERGLRPGTQSPPLALAFAAALTECAGSEKEFAKRAERMRTDFVRKLSGELPQAIVNVGKAHSPHILNISFPGIDTDYASVLLDNAGFAVSTRSACETDAEGSRAVLAMTGDEERSASTIRISWGPDSRENDLERLRYALVRTIRFLEMNALY